MIFGSWTYDMSNVNVKGFNFGGSGDTTINVGSGHEVFNAGQKVKYILTCFKSARHLARHRALLIPFSSMLMFDKQMTTLFNESQSIQTFEPTEITFSKSSIDSRLEHL